MAEDKDKDQVKEEKDLDREIEDGLMEDVGEGPGCFGGLMAGVLLALVVFIVLFYVTCTQQIKPWEVGVRYLKISAGEPKILRPGRNIKIPLLHDIQKYDCRLQKFEMAPRFPDAPDPDAEPLKIRTARDQDEIEVFVTIFYRVERSMAAQLKKHYANDDLIRTNGIAIVGKQELEKALGKIMTANQFYSMSGEKRRQIKSMRKENPHYLKELYPTDDYLLDRKGQAEEALDSMRDFFRPKGVVIERILIWDFKFGDEIEASIISKVIADEQVKMEEAVKMAADAKADWEKLVAEANAAAEAELARGTAEATKIEAEASRYMVEKEAEGDKLILEAQAEGKGKINRALAGVGGKTYVGLEYAKALEGIDLIVVPAGGKDGFNPLMLDEAIENIQPRTYGSAGGE